MLRDLQPYAVAGLMTLSVAAAAKAAESALVDLPRQSGPSRFVTGLDGKPAELGRPAPGAHIGEPNAVVIVPTIRMPLEPESRFSEDALEKGVGATHSGNTPETGNAGSERLDREPEDDPAEIGQPEDAACKPLCDGD